MARHLRWQQRLTGVKWGSGVTAAITVAGAQTIGFVLALTAGAVVGLPLLVWVARKPTAAGRWQQGAEAEERTADLLAKLERDGWVILHDRAIKGSKANVDHLAIHPSGRFTVMVDTKAWHSRNAPIRWERKALRYGRFDKTESLRTVEWIAKKASQALNVPSIPMVSIDGGVVTAAIIKNNRKVADAVSGFLQIDDSYVVESGILVTTLRGIDGGKPNPRAVKKLTKAAGHSLPQKH